VLKQSHLPSRRIAIGQAHLLSVRVYDHDSNPKIDRHKYAISRTEAAHRLARGYVLWISPTQVQLKPPPGFVPGQQIPNYSTMRDAWKPRMSDKYLVLQMRTPTSSDL
jgi:hypothetical protein